MNRRLVTGAVAAVLATTPLLTAPAFAEDPPPTTITVRAFGPSEQPLAHIEVVADRIDEADHDEPPLYLGTTNSDGQIVKSDGGFQGERIDDGGEFALHFYDRDDYRDFRGTSFSAPSIRATLVTGTDNVVDVAFKPGGRIVGKATAPSGRALANLDLKVKAPDTGDDALYTRTGSIDDTEPGAYAANGLQPAKYYVAADTSANSNAEGDPYAYRGPAKNVTIADFGQTKTVNLTDVQVTCRTSLAATSTTSGAVTLKAGIDARYFGLATPGGTVVLSRGTTTLKSFTWTGSVKTLSLTNQPRGKKVAYYLSYSKGDCVKFRAGKAVTVRR